MIDIKLIRENKELVKENIKKKFQDKKLPLVDEVYDMDIKYRKILVKLLMVLILNQKMKKFISIIR